MDGNSFANGHTWQGSGRQEAKGLQQGTLQQQALHLMHGASALGGMSMPRAGRGICIRHDLSCEPTSLT
jgi:hypothetical protein